MTKKNDTVVAKYAELKKLSAEKKEAKKLLEKKVADAWAEYKKFVKETYKPARKAACDAIDKAKAEAEAERAKVKAEKKTAKKVVVKKNAVTADEVIAAGEKSLKKFKAKAEKKIAEVKAEVKAENVTDVKAE